MEHTLFSAALMEEAEWVVEAAEAFVLGANEEVAEMRDAVQLEREVSLSNVLMKVEHWVLIPEGMREDCKKECGVSRCFITMSERSLRIKHDGYPVLSLQYYTIGRNFATTSQRKRRFPISHPPHCPAHLTAHWQKR